VGAVAKYCDTYVCVCESVCLSVHKDISGTTCAIFYQYFAHVAYGRGSVILRRHCDTLCNSGFVDDIMFFFYNWPYSDVNFATRDQFRLNLFVYHKMEQNSISYY